MDKDVEKQLASGSIFKLLMKLSIPMIAAQLVNVLYNIVDRMYIGRIEGVGVTALTGVGVSMPIIVIITAFASLIGTGGAPIASIKMGEGKMDEAEKTLSNSFTLLCTFGIVLPLIYYIFKDKLLYIFGASAETFIYANQYTSIYVLGSIFVMLTLGLNSYINSQGFAKIGMCTVIIGAILNIVLDPILIFGFNLGVKGAAIATVISQGASAMWALKFLLSDKSALKIRKKYLKVEIDIVKATVALGLSPFIMQSTEALLQISFNTNLQRYGGDMYIAVMTVILSVNQILFLPLQGFAQGAQPIIGYNYGACNFDRVRTTAKYLIICCLTYAGLGWLATLTIPDKLILLFNDDPLLLAEGAKCLRIYFAMAIMMGLQTSSQQIFVSLGQARLSIFFALLRKVFLLIPLIYIIPKLGGGVNGIFMAEPIADTISASSCFITFVFFMKKIERVRNISA